MLATTTFVKLWRAMLAATGWFTTAIKGDLAGKRVFHSQGKRTDSDPLRGPPPSEREAFGKCCYPDILAKRLPLRGSCQPQAD